MIYYKFVFYLQKINQIFLINRKSIRLRHKMKGGEKYESTIYFDYYCDLFHTGK
jgi:hypothetical protein